VRRRPRGLQGEGNLKWQEPFAARKETKKRGKSQNRRGTTPNFALLLLFVKKRKGTGGRGGVQGKGKTGEAVKKAEWLKPVALKTTPSGGDRV